MVLNVAERDEVVDGEIVCRIDKSQQVLRHSSMKPSVHSETCGIINNAGIIRDGMMAKNRKTGMKVMSNNKWRQVIDVNLTVCS